MTLRRPLRFERLDQVMPEVERLLEGHSTVGKWSLGQICNHLEMAVRKSVEGYDERAPWPVRKLIGPIMRWRLFKTGRMPEGIKLPERFLPKPGLDARDEAERLRSALALFATNTGSLAVHPIFDRISREDWERLHRIHCAHHLSFALPNGDAGTEPRTR